MKKRILFAIPSLQVGGAEKSMVSLLNSFDFNKYEIDLLLLTKSNDLRKNLPKEVNVIFPSEDYFVFSTTLFRAVLTFALGGKFRKAVHRVLYSAVLYRYRQNRNKAEQYSFVYLKGVLQDLQSKSYDAGIGFLEKTSIYLIVDCVTAKTKIGFIRTDYAQLKTDSLFDAHYFSKLNYLCTNGEISAETIKNYFPQMSDKIKIVKNVISSDHLFTLSEEIIPERISSPFTIVSIGRLVDAKGFDLAVNAAAILVSKGIEFQWLIIGEGTERQNLQSAIDQLNIGDRFKLLGSKENPYPYLKKADIYVQTSRYEGKSSTINEAKIFKKPIVTTDFPSVFEQITHGKNGLICKMDAKSIACAIEKFCLNDGLRENLSLNLASENLETSSEVKKLYNLISG